jgi:tape measure domain-containing protein
MSIFREIFGVISFKDNASNAIDKVDSKMDSSKAKAIGLQGAMQAIGGAYFIKKTFDVVGSLVELSAQMEDTTTSFEVMLGSAEAAKTMVDDLIKFSDVTPFEDMQITDAAKMLMNFGIAADDVMPSIQMLGDVSGGNAEKFSRLSLAFGQVSSQGKLMGQDLLQMINAGFNPLQEISKTTGKSMAQLKDEMSKGLVSFDMVQSAFMSATGEGGRFHDMMKKQSETWHGLISTFNGLRNSAMRVFGDILQKALKPILKGLIQITQAFVTWAKTEKGMAILKATLVGLVPVIGTLMVGAVIALATAFWGLLAPLLPIVGIALLIGAAFAILFLVAQDIYTFFKGGDSYFGDFMKYIGVTKEELIELVTAIKDTVVNMVTLGGLLSFDNLKKGISFLSTAIDKLKQFNELIKGLTGINVGESFKKGILRGIPGVNIPFLLKDFADIAHEKNTPGKASGGYVHAGNPYIVGEQGRELFIPGSTGQIMPNNSFGGVTVSKLVGSINITVQNADEGVEVIKTKILDALNELSSSVFPAAAGVVI